MNEDLEKILIKLKESFRENNEKRKMRQKKKLRKRESYLLKNPVEVVLLGVRALQKELKKGYDISKWMIDNAEIEIKKSKLLKKELLKRKTIKSITNKINRFF